MKEQFRRFCPLPPPLFSMHLHQHQHQRQHQRQRRPGEIIPGALRAPAGSSSSSNFKCSITRRGAAHGSWVLIKLVFSFFRSFSTKIHCQSDGPKKCRFFSSNAGNSHAIRHKSKGAVGREGRLMRPRPTGRPAGSLFQPHPDDSFPPPPRMNCVL